MLLLAVFSCCVPMVGSRSFRQGDVDQCMIGEPLIEK